VLAEVVYFDDSVVDYLICVSGGVSIIERESRRHVQHVTWLPWPCTRRLWPWIPGQR